MVRKGLEFLKSNRYMTDLTGFTLKYHRNAFEFSVCMSNLHGGKLRMFQKKQGNAIILNKLIFLVAFTNYCCIVISTFLLIFLNIGFDNGKLL